VTRSFSGALWAHIGAFVTGSGFETAIRVGAAAGAQKQKLGRPKDLNRLESFECQDRKGVLYILSIEGSEAFLTDAKCFGHDEVFFNSKETMRIRRSST
jgi:hypothetical protein